MVVASRYAYELWRGFIPVGMFVCHTCDNPPCCNPEHLFTGTHDDNMADKVAKGRQSRGDTHAAALKPATGLANGAHTHPERVLRGEGHPSSVLTTLNVFQIRSLYRSGLYLQKAGRDHA